MHHPAVGIEAVGHRGAGVVPFRAVAGCVVAVVKVQAGNGVVPVGEVAAGVEELKGSVPFSIPFQLFTG